MNKANETHKLQTILDALYQQRASIWDAAYQLIKDTEQQRQAQERIIQAQRFAAQHLIDKQIDALVKEFTERAGLESGDVVRFLNADGRIKSGDLAIVTSVNKEDIGVELEGGNTTVNVYELALVIDPNLRDAWKLSQIANTILSAAQYKYFDAPNCESKLSDARTLITGMIARLGGAA